MVANNENAAAIPHAEASFAAKEAALAPLFTYVAERKPGMEKSAIARAAGEPFTLSGAQTDTGIASIVLNHDVP